MSEDFLTKVGVIANGERRLFVIDKTLKLDENIRTIKQKFNLNENFDCGLKIIDGKSKRKNVYVTEETFTTDIQDGNLLEVVQSLQQCVIFIFQNISNPLEKQKCCDLVYDLSVDPAFRKKLYENGKCEEFMKLLTHANLNDKGKLGCLLAMLKLLQENCIEFIPTVTLMAVIMEVTKQSPSSQYALSVLAQILLVREAEMSESKFTIISNISIDNLMQFVDNHVIPELPLNAFLLINAIIRNTKDEKRQSIIKELNSKRNRNKIYKLMCKKSVGDKLACQLFILQSYMLTSKYRKDLIKDVSRASLDWDFQTRVSEEEIGTWDFSNYDAMVSSTDSLLHGYKDVVSRYSLASITSRTNSSYSDNFCSSSNSISLLTYNCIVFFKSKYFPSFCQSLSEENQYEPGICKSSDRIIAIIADVLKIGKKLTKNCTRFTPLYFDAMNEHFIEELFVRMMYLLSRTRKDMKVNQMEDYEKLMLAVKKQLEMQLDKRDENFKEFHKSLHEINYTTVKNQWKKERDADWKFTLKENPCVTQLVTYFSTENEKLLYEQRMLILKAGQVFPKLPEKKYKSQVFNLKLSSNGKAIFYGDWNEKCNDWTSNVKSVVNLDQIRHFVTGLACPHIKDGSVPESRHNCVFTIMLEGEVTINCLTTTEKQANQWIDGFNLLLGKPHRSSHYLKELKTLCEMDCALHIIELQTVKLPIVAPPVPKLPKDY